MNELFDDMEQSLTFFVGRKRERTIEKATREKQAQGRISDSYLQEMKVNTWGLLEMAMQEYKSKKHLIENDDSPIDMKTRLRKYLIFRSIITDLSKSYNALDNALKRGQEEGWTCQETFDFYLWDLYDYLDEYDTEQFLRDCKIIDQACKTNVMISAVGGWGLYNEPVLRNKAHLQEVLSEAAIEADKLRNTTDREDFWINMMGAPGAMLYHIEQLNRTVFEDQHKHERNTGKMLSQSVDLTSTMEIADPVDAIRNLIDQLAFISDIEQFLNNNQKQILKLLYKNPELAGYGGNKELAKLTGRSEQQIAVEKKRAFDTIRSKFTQNRKAQKI